MMTGLMTELPQFEDSNEGGDKIKEKKNPLVIYHGKCADGFGAAWVFYNAQERSETTFDFHAGVYNDPPPDVTGRVVYMVDFSYTVPVLEAMVKEAKHVYLIDHHKTAIDAVLATGKHENGLLSATNFTTYVDINRSGAMLAWDFIYNTTWLTDRLYALYSVSDFAYKQPPRLLEHIQDRDLWKFKLPNTREIQANLFSHEYDFEQWTKMMEAGPSELLQMTVAGAAIERKHFKDIKELIDVARRIISIGGFAVPCASLPYTMSSDAGHIMASDYKEGKVFAACYTDTAEHRIFSLRSTESGIDVSDIAKQYGGGGHRNAAGFRVNRDHDLARV